MARARPVRHAGVLADAIGGDEMNDKPIVIPMEDPIIHTNDKPFCKDTASCPCHQDPILLDEMAKHLLNGELTYQEARRIWRGEQEG